MEIGLARNGNRPFLRTVSYCFKISSVIGSIDISLDDEYRKSHIGRLQSIMMILKRYVNNSFRDIDTAKAFCYRSLTV